MMMQTMQCIYVASVVLCSSLMFILTKEKGNCTLLDVLLILFASFTPFVNIGFIVYLFWTPFLEWAETVTVFVWKDDK